MTTIYDISVMLLINIDNNIIVDDMINHIN